MDNHSSDLLKLATEFVVVGRSIGVPEEHLVGVMNTLDYLPDEAFRAFLSWFWSGRRVN